MFGPTFRGTRIDYEDVELLSSRIKCRIAIE